MRSTWGGVRSTVRSLAYSYPLNLRSFSWPWKSKSSSSQSLPSRSMMYQWLLSLSSACSASDTTSSFFSLMGFISEEAVVVPPWHTLPRYFVQNIGGASKVFSLGLWA